MKIGIISLKVNANYGGLLQAWALQQVLKRMGHEPELIDGLDPCDLSIVQKMIKYPFRIIKKIIFHSKVPVRHEKIIYDKWHRSMQGVSRFIGKIDRRQILSLDELNPGEYDLIIFGSDQVWRPLYARNSFLQNNMRNAFGWFAKDWNNVKLASYAASFGIDSLKEFTREELVDIKLILMSFCGIAVREKSGVELCRQLGVEAKHVIDPTMLLDEHDYMSLLYNVEVPQRKGIMTYVLDFSSEATELINQVAKQNGTQVFSTLSTDPEHPLSLEQWLAGFRDSKLVITDSFHACVFSILFNRPFIVIANTNRGTARIESLLATFGLQHHLVDAKTIKELKSISQFSIDCNKLQSTLRDLRNYATGYLTNILTK